MHPDNLLDLYFFFCGWHLLFSVYMIIGIPSTGSAGLIQTVSMFSRGHLAAAILGTFASVGWTLQGVGNAFFYRMVRLEFCVDYRQFGSGSPRFLMQTFA